jgi:hypothetical protein
MTDAADRDWFARHYIAASGKAPLRLDYDDDARLMKRDSMTGTVTYSTAPVAGRYCGDLSHLETEEDGAFAPDFPEEPAIPL